jgi:hypothetical protein
MSEPNNLQITFDHEQVKEWFDLCRHGINPPVPYQPDNSEMLKAAYEIRGEVLTRIYNDLHKNFQP